MKKTKICSLLMLIGLLLPNAQILAQNSLSILPLPELNAVCPNDPVTYTISNWNTTCHTVDIQNKGSIQSKTYNEDDHTYTLVVLWDNKPDTPYITVTRNTSTGCMTAAPDKKWKVFIKSITGLKPTVTLAPSAFPIGIQLPVACTSDHIHLTYYSPTGKSGSS